MYIKNKLIDEGKAFDWGRTSKDYAQYRDIYPEEFYQKLIDMGLGIKGQSVLDIGTGTGVLPRNLYKYGAEFKGTDISENQIIQARALAKECNMEIDFSVVSAEKMDFLDNSFDVIMACQCFVYFDYEKLVPLLSKMLKPRGKFVVLYMAWLPNEDRIAGASEKLILKYNPVWNGAGEERHAIQIPNVVHDYFDIDYSEVYDLNVPFTRDSWHGRMKACRGVGASLSDKNIEQWDKEHRQLLNEIAPDSFGIQHYAAILVLKSKK